MAEELSSLARLSAEIQWAAGLHAPPAAASSMKDGLVPESPKAFASLTLHFLQLSMLQYWTDMDTDACGHQQSKKGTR